MILKESRLRSACALVSALVASAPACGDQSFGRADVEAIAERMGASPHVPPEKVAPAFLDLTYDTYRLIAQRHERAMWRDAELSTWVEFFPAGFLHQYPVRIHVVDNGASSPIPYSSQWFQFRGQAESLRDEPGGGFAGFRLLTRLPGNEHPTEYLAFLGASYFRGIGSGQWYGSSARGLAIDIGLPRPEEFPRFTDFWIQRPAETDAGSASEEQVVWALLESPGVVGAYEFRIRPGRNLPIGVHAKLWRRHGIQKLAVAPLTSMWMWDNGGGPAGDNRPEVHDADGLLIHRDADQWVWRGLTNPETPRVERWRAEELHGFGLVQRDRDPANYADSEARYHLRPSVWVQPDADHPWEAGHVELLELPAPHEGVDNIGAYFVMDSTSRTARDPIELDYELTFGVGLPAGRSVAVIKTEQIDQPAGEITVRFQAAVGQRFNSTAAIGAVAKASTPLEVVVRSIEIGAEEIEVTVGVPPAGEEEPRIEVWLEQAGKTVSEIGSYRWTR
ncbi:Glucans biosynthesis protein G precursor [Posidoniimonas polymericola]|uniref:Glucans biosynthesis protein G n=1 Tax=Posidoniimonas polymericola TaxID=2528002 RepID=A0A5C5ZFB6_9BACT|nr:glucan biosynthesis protein [Posidoniimonas polymericola]TWT85886.1 Glucans biosynthesis protein G precursor [Posidoniimonas polymericola]